MKENWEGNLNVFNRAEVLCKILISINYTSDQYKIFLSIYAQFINTNKDKTQDILKVILFLNCNCPLKSVSLSSHLSHKIFFVILHFIFNTAFP